MGGNVGKRKDGCPSGVAECNVNPRAEMVIFLFLVTHKCAKRQIEERLHWRAILRKGHMGRDPAGGRKGEEEGQRVTDTKKTRGTREKAKSRSCYEGNNGRKRKERRRPTHTEMGGQTGKRTPGPKHKRGAQKRSKRRENPKHRITLKFPHRVRSGSARTKWQPAPTRATTPTQGQGLPMGKVQGLEVQSRPGIRRACGPKPLAQPPALPPQDPGQWAGEGGVILHPSSPGSGWRKPGYLSLWGREGNPGICLPEKGETGKGQAGFGPCLRLMLWRPLPWGRCQPGAQECG